MQPAFHMMSFMSLLPVVYLAILLSIFAAIFFCFCLSWSWFCGSRCPGVGGKTSSHGPGFGSLDAQSLVSSSTHTLDYSPLGEANSGSGTGSAADTGRKSVSFASPLGREQMLGLEKQLLEVV